MTDERERNALEPSANHADVRVRFDDAALTSPDDVELRGLARGLASRHVALGELGEGRDELR